MRELLNGAVSASDLDILDATGLATALMGDSIATIPSCSVLRSSAARYRCRWKRS